MTDIADKSDGIIWTGGTSHDANEMVDGLQVGQANPEFILYHDSFTPEKKDFDGIICVWFILVPTEDSINICWMKEKISKYQFGLGYQAFKYPETNPKMDLERVTLVKWYV